MKQSVIKTENELNLLLGRLPQPIKRPKSIFMQSVLNNIHTGLPSQLLVRRPDIQASQMKLIAAGFDVSAARKSFLPSLNITPYTGFNSFNASMMFTPASIAYGIIGGVSGPVWNRGRLKGMLKDAVASEGEAWYDYQQSVFRAYQEVVTCMNAISNNTALYELKKKQVTEIETKLGLGLDWQVLPDSHACRLVIYKPNFDLENEAQWQECYEWLAKNAANFNLVFRPLLRDI